MTSLSSGERQIFVLITHLFFNPAIGRENVLLIDEPELSLHLKWQRQFVTAIRQAKHKVPNSISSLQDKSKFISGKYLVATLLRWFQSETEFRGKQNQLLSLILSNSKLDLDPKLRRALRRAAR